MKNFNFKSILLSTFFFLSICILPACSGDDAPELTEQEEAFNAYCDNTNGSISAVIGGKNWSSNCVTGAITDLTATTDLKILTVFVIPVQEQLLAQATGKPSI